MELFSYQIYGMLNLKYNMVSMVLSKTLAVMSRKLQSFWSVFSLELRLRNDTMLSIIWRNIVNMTLNTDAIRDSESLCVQQVLQINFTSDWLREHKKNLWIKYLLLWQVVSAPPSNETLCLQD